MIRSHLARANRYIAELRADIARERVIIEHALDAGYPSAVAESMLRLGDGWSHDHAEALHTPAWRAIAESW